MTTLAIVFAAGLGTRANTDPPKQFATVRSKPVLAHTLQRLDSHPQIDAIYLVAPAAHLAQAAALATPKVRQVVPGGDSAHASIICGLEAARPDASDDDIVLFHDGVRPVIDAATITRCVASVRDFGSAITSIPAYETVAESSDGEWVDSVTVRSQTYILQAPQAFRFGHAYALNQRAVADQIVGQVVDQAELNRRYGYRVHLVPGLRGNTKLTTAYDLEVFAALAEAGVYE
ncbi:MAG: 2-C-methyl-D-erythritol 4-phosphate cytidylyltransferase [Propionibacteriaceae bacterium]|jgi:2-C-methyl-D-erythritol 4-phosphate cytidylyltransferase|nr:2-C-methyl-D-erythritol 4-phosphate cytidylyltransferase [Propionibacteriaceae bacterium]